MSNPWLVPTVGQMPEPWKEVELLVHNQEGKERLIHGKAETETNWTKDTARLLRVGEWVAGWRKVSWRAKVDDNLVVTALQHTSRFFEKELSGDERLEFLQEYFSCCMFCGSLDASNCWCRRDD